MAWIDGWMDPFQNTTTTRAPGDAKEYTFIECLSFNGFSCHLLPTIRTITTTAQQPFPFSGGGSLSSSTLPGPC